MKKTAVILFLFALAGTLAFKSGQNDYATLYADRISSFRQAQLTLLDRINDSRFSSPGAISELKAQIAVTRIQLKSIDFWLRYLEPIAYKKINGPLPVEWENEVFEKFEKPYKREGAGLSLAELYLNDPAPQKDSLVSLICISLSALNTFTADSVTRQLRSPAHFYFCNRLFLLNLAALYTTGFECPDNKHIIPELRAMLTAVKSIYTAFGNSYPAEALPVSYLDLYNNAIAFANTQPSGYEQFDHYGFIRNYVNPLFAANQELIRKYDFNSTNTNDFTLNNNCNSIFDKALYSPQNSKGIFSLVDDTAVLLEIRHIGKLLFYDPILSGNNARSCVSCHKSKEYFTDTTAATSLAFDRHTRLPRNTPSLVNVVYNHLLMLDGRHISLQNQAKDVMTNPVEMGGHPDEIIEKVMSCREYRTAFRKFLKYTPEEHEVNMEHIASALTFYYKDFSAYSAPFDDAMNRTAQLSSDAKQGFNLFMSKAQCGTCHYVPQFNGVPPPYISSEFEVVGTPADKQYSALSADSGRYRINPAFETLFAFRTGSLRNAAFTKPYMHNGVFNSLTEVVDFYDAGGGAGHHFAIANQTLSADSLHLTPSEKNALIAFLQSLNENISFEDPPETLPASNNKALNSRKVGGEY